MYLLQLIYMHTRLEDMRESVKCERNARRIIDEDEMMKAKYSHVVERRRKEYKSHFHLILPL